MRGLLATCLFGFGMLMATSSVTMAAPPKWKPAVDAVLKPYQAKAPGIAVGILRNGKLVYACGAGLANLDTGERISADTNFRLASVTKQLVAAGILTLVRDGKLSLDDTLPQVFPGFPAYGEKITIRQLLQHRSGTLDYEDFVDEKRSTQVSDAEVLQWMKQQDHTLFEPGTRFRYSNTGYVLLGLVLEQRGGQSVNAYLDDKVFAPLRMQHTIAYAGEATLIAHRAYGHSLQDGKAMRNDQSPTSATLGDGGVYSSINDMAKWLRSLDKPSAVLNSAALREMFTAVPNEETTGSGYGEGWFIDTVNGIPRQWHTGHTRGSAHKVVRFPTRGLTLIVLGNLNDGPAPELADEIAGLVDPGVAIRKDQPPPVPEVR